MPSGVSASIASSVFGNLFASVDNDATTQVVSRPIIDCGGCHGVREVCRALFPSAVEAANDKAELATARNAMS
ncbi:hypothetical protein BMD20_15625 [Burkholderia multivorans]|nr:hypothetical protein BMD22_23305 [Burkholderia multivorans]KHS14526.1 hypothetical protein BMD20_15625 [Burkholderia multivorans]PRD71151.1 hypothetical protein C6P75_26580 [Burkholderia multivorans]